MTLLIEIATCHFAKAKYTQLNDIIKEIPALALLTQNARNGMTDILLNNTIQKTTSKI